MSPFAPLARPTLPALVERVLADFLQALQTTFGKDLCSVVLYGSAAEGKLRPTSDVNLLLALNRFEQAQADALRQPLRVAHAAIQVRPIYLLREEISYALRSFAPKFSGILRRRVILLGEDPFGGIMIPRDAEIRQLQQQLLNFTLRARAGYIARGLREEQLVLFLAELIGPLRAMSAAWLELEGKPVSSPREAIARAGTELALSNWAVTAEAIQTLQDAPLQKARAAARFLFDMLEFVRRMRERAEHLSSEVDHESI